MTTGNGLNRQRKVKLINIQNTVTESSEESRGKRSEAVHRQTVRTNETKWHQDHTKGNARVSSVKSDRETVKKDQKSIKM
jgi:hypothetical protein